MPNGELTAVVKCIRASRRADCARPSPAAAGSRGRGNRVAAAGGRDRSWQRRGALYLGAALERGWQHEDALASFAKAIDLDARQPSPWSGLNSAALALGRDSQAAGGTPARAARWNGRPVLDSEPAGASP